MTESDSEERFLLNLTRMTLATEGVSVEHFLQCIQYINSANVSELVFLESEYMSILTNDRDLEYPVYDAEVFTVLLPHQACIHF